MARPRKAEPTHTSLVASAVRLPRVKPGKVAVAEGWQALAWSYYDSCPELRFTANWVGNIMSRAELVTVEEAGQTDKTLESGSAYEALAAYFDGQYGQAEMLRSTGIHLTVAGECYHFFIAEDNEWHVIAVGKVKEHGSGKNAYVEVEWNGEKRKVTEKDILIRVWNPHPIDPVRADSPVRANLEVLAEIDRCNKHIQATLVSRLAGAGILFIPQDITFPVPEDADPSASSADVFMAVLGEAMSNPIQEPGAASAYVPIVVQAPGDSLNQIKHLTFWSEVSSSVREMRDAAVKRLALGMDIPPEVLLGMADSNHWNAWLVDEASVKAHTEPRLACVTNAITTAYLQPALEGVESDPKQYAVVADTSNIRLRPNRSKEALELYDRGALNEEAVRRETGFEAEDAPDPAQFNEWLLRKIALGSTSPEQTQAALEALNVPVAAPVDTGAEANRERPPRIDNRRSLDEHPTRDIPSDDALIAACDVLVYRALERAGNRLRTSANFTGKDPASDVYLSVKPTPRSIDTLMGDAWSCLPRVLEGHDVDRVTPILDGYVRGLLLTQTPHSRDTLRRVLVAS
jgi:hypothetical protein